MKSLSLSVPYVIFVIGKPGVGKTQFATKLAETFNLPYVEADRLRSALTDKPTYSSEEQERVDYLVTIQMSELFKTKSSFILEGGTEAKTVRQNLSKFAKDKGYESLFVWVQTDHQTAYARATKSNRLNKQKTFILSDERYHQLEKRFTAPGVSERPVVISGKHTHGSQIKSVLKRLAVKNRPEAPKLAVPTRETIKGNSIKVL